MSMSGEALGESYSGDRESPATLVAPDAGLPLGESETAARPRSKLKMIRTECAEHCVDGDGEVRRCAFFACPLWPFRMGKNPFPLSAAQRAQRAKAAETSPLALSGCPDSPRGAVGDGPPNFRGPNDLAAPSERLTLGQLRSLAGRNLPMGSVQSPDPREMTVDELAALGCTNRSVAKAIRQYEREVGRGIVG